MDKKSGKEKEGFSTRLYFLSDSTKHKIHQKEINRWGWRKKKGKKKKKHPNSIIPHKHKKQPHNKSTKTYFINFLKKLFVYIQKPKRAWMLLLHVYYIFDKSLFQEAVEDL